jgi:glycerol-1-phosphate dehydrogenase [NAD(P)+]
MGSPLGARDDLDTKFFLEEPGCLERVPEVLAKINTASRPVLLVCDENTKRAAGERVERILAAARVPFVEKLLRPKDAADLSPDYAWVSELRAALGEGNRFPLAVGSGAINDLVKRASSEAGTPYLCVATASSMDGYASFGAALVKDGYKLTMPCAAPAAIVADTEVLRAAPYDMTAAGYGDLYAKLASGTDWILADRLGIEPVNREAWDLVQRDLAAWVASPEKLKEGDSGAFSGLFKGLTMSGIAMQVYRDSRTASGAEHLVSHIWEMAHLSRDGRPLSHGFKVAVGTALSVSLMEALYSYPPERLSAAGILAKRESWEGREAAIRRAFPVRSIGDQALEASRAKWPDDRALLPRLEKLIALLPEMRRVFRERLGSPERVRADLKKAGCPVSPAEFGLGRDEVREALLKAQMIRKRYTVLDAAYELGLLEELAERV